MNELKLFGLGHWSKGGHERRTCNACDKNRLVKSDYVTLPCGGVTLVNLCKEDYKSEVVVTFKEHWHSPKDRHVVRDPESLRKYLTIMPEMHMHENKDVSFTFTMIPAFQSRYCPEIKLLAVEAKPVIVTGDMV